MLLAANPAADTMPPFKKVLLEICCPNADLLLVVSDRERYDAMCTELHRIGYDNIYGYLLGGIGSWLFSGRPVEKLAQRAHQRAVGPRHFPQNDLDGVGGEAGRRGEFALVIGVDRIDQAAALAEHGADVVVSDLAELLPAAPPADDPGDDS